MYELWVGILPTPDEYGCFKPGGNVHEHLSDARLTVNLAKCEFVKVSVNYLSGIGIGECVRGKGRKMEWYPKLAVSVSCRLLPQPWKSPIS